MYTKFNILIMYNDMALVLVYYCHVNQDTSDFACYPVNSLYTRVSTREKRVQKIVLKHYSYKESADKRVEGLH